MYGICHQQLAYADAVPSRPAFYNKADGDLRNSCHRCAGEAGSRATTRASREAMPARGTMHRRTAVLTNTVEYQQYTSRTRAWARARHPSCWDAAGPLLGASWPGHAGSGVREQRL